MPEEGGGYLKYPDGTLIQWGSAYFLPASQGGNGVAIVTLPQEYASIDDYRIIASPDYPPGPLAVFDVSTQRSTKNKINLYGRTKDGGIITGAYASWLTIGRWK